jgi:Fe-S-cluster containining protein
MQIDKPKCKSDYDKIRWYLMHENIWVSIDLCGNWILEFRTPCRNIDKDNRCSDYENRPKLCKDYPGKNELCERQTEELCYVQLFTNATEFEKYLDEQKINWRFKGKKQH